ncbi:MAG: FG-GAP repeat domain-containing protein, partial [Pyrinomonadaceae bacterium]
MFILLARTLIVCGLTFALVTFSARSPTPYREVVQTSHPSAECAELDVKQARTTSLPTFDRRLQLETTSDTSANVSFGDVDGDGKLDIVLAKGRHWPLVDRVLLGDGRGAIRTAYNLDPTADRSYSGRLVDIDGDGDLDVVISNDAPDPKRVYLNDGKGHFRRGSTYGHPEWETRNASIADLDGDRLPDIIVANRSERADGANYICLNKGKGQFDADCIAFSRYPATTITPADFNRDGRIDLAVPHRDGGQSFIYLAGPKASFADSQRIPFGPPEANIRMTQAADFDGDGFMDIVAIDERTGVAIYFGKRSGFSAALSIGDKTIVPYALAVGDLNNDKKMDIVVGNVEAPSTAYFNDGSGRNFKTVHFGDNKGTVYG